MCCGLEGGIVGGKGATFRFDGWDSERQSAVRADWLGDSTLLRHEPWFLPWLAFCIIITQKAAGLGETCFYSGICTSNACVASDIIFKSKG